MRFPVMFSIMMFAFAASAVQAQTIEIQDEVIEGNPVALQIEGLIPNEQVTLDIRRVTVDGLSAESSTVLDVGADGILNPAADEALTGSYRGIDPAGPFWAMRPGGRSATGRGTLEVSLRRSSDLVAQRTVKLLPFSRAVSVEEVSAFSGARLYRPRGEKPLPLIIVLGGSEGGSSSGRTIAPRLAELGYAALALPYYNPPWTGEDLPGLPQAFVNIPVDRLEAVKQWTDSRDDLAADRIAIYGVSKGGEFAMLAAARYPWLRAVIGIVPSDVVWEGWGTGAAEETQSSFSWQGEPLDFVPYLGMSDAINALARGESRSLSVPHLEGRRANPDRAAKARIPVEQFGGAMLIAGGDRDTTWPSGEMVRAIAERRAENTLATTALSFAEAGHGLAGTGWTPINYARADASVAANSVAQKRIWQETIEFLRKHLGESTEP